MFNVKVNKNYTMLTDSVKYDTPISIVFDLTDKIEVATGMLTNIRVQNIGQKMVNIVYFIVIKICKENMEAWFFTYSFNEIYIYICRMVFY